MFDVVNRLLKVTADPVVTITAPFDRRRPNNEADRIRLRNLLAEAHSEVTARYDRDVATAVLGRLDAAAADFDPRQGAYGIVVIATPDMAESHLLPFPVREAVAVASTPATRFLVQGLRRSPRYRLLVLSDRATRLFEGMRDDLHEVEHHGFPMAADVVPRDLRSVAGRFAREPAGDDKEQWRAFYREVDQALIEVGRDDPLPILLAGVERSVAMFEDVANSTRLVIGHINGAQEDATAHGLGEKAWPILRDHLKARRREVIAELAETVHTEKAVTGIDEVWPLIRQGRGRLLVVEEDYRAEPSREVDGELVRVDGAGPDVMDDPVDELIEHLMRAGGSVEFVATDALEDHGRIGLLLR